MKPTTDCEEGTRAAERFQAAMRGLFQVRKDELPPEKKAPPKSKTAQAKNRP